MGVPGFPPRISPVSREFVSPILYEYGMKKGKKSLHSERMQGCELSSSINQSRAAAIVIVVVVVVVRVVIVIRIVIRIVIIRVVIVIVTARGNGE